MSLFKRIWLTVISLTLAAFFGSLLVNTLTARSYIEKQLFIKNQDNATALALSMSQQVDKDPVTMELLLSALFDNGHYQAIRLIDPAGKVIVERIAPADIDPGAPAWFVGLLPIRVEPGIAHIAEGWKQYGSISLASHSKFAYQDLWRGTLELIGWFLSGGVLAGLLATLMLRLITRPLDQVVDQARAIAERRFIRVNEPKVPELKSVVSAMNDMVARLRQMFAEEAARLDAMRDKLNHDIVTALPNRDHFMSRLREALESEESAAFGALVLLRLDNLGEINRLLGRGETDRLLRAIAAMLKTLCIGQEAWLPARLNGSDLAILAPNLPESSTLAHRMATDLLTLRDRDFAAIGDLFAIGALHYRRGDPIGTVLAGCDRLLALAENRGANAVIVEEASGSAAAALPAESWRGLIAEALREARIGLVNFPVVGTRDAVLLHREGMIRLRTESNGPWRPAGDFMPFATRLKLVAPLDLEVAKLALEALQRENGHLAINLTPDTVASSESRQRLVKLLAAHPAICDRLWIEVPEHGTVIHFDAFQELVRSLKALGCRIGIENFGRQLAAADKLAALGVDYVKIDGQFVRDIDSNEGNREFLAGLCRMAHNLGILVIAVGVRTPAEFKTLSALGFDGVTGPAVGEPPTRMEES